MESSLSFGGVGTLGTFLLSKIGCLLAADSFSLVALELVNLLGSIAQHPLPVNDI